MTFEGWIKLYSVFKGAESSACGRIQRCHLKQGHSWPPPTKSTKSTKCPVFMSKSKLCSVLGPLGVGSERTLQLQIPNVGCPGSLRPSSVKHRELPCIWWVKIRSTYQDRRAPGLDPQLTRLHPDDGHGFSQNLRLMDRLFHRRKTKSIRRPFVATFAGHGAGWSWRCKIARPPLSHWPCHSLRRKRPHLQKAVQVP